MINDVILFQKTRFTAYMLWAKEVRQELLEKCPNMGKIINSNFL